MALLSWITIACKMRPSEIFRDFLEGLQRGTFRARLWARRLLETVVDVFMIPTIVRKWPSARLSRLGISG